MEGMIDAGTQSLIQNGVGWDMVGDMAFGAAVGAATGGMVDYLGPTVRKVLGRLPGCFVAGTLVVMADGSVAPIESIREGDLVSAYDESAGVVASARVTHTFQRCASDLVAVIVDDQTIRATCEHPFFVANVGWVPAEQLKEADHVLTCHGDTKSVRRVERLPSSLDVYNFEVEGFHTYFVTLAGLLVHNSCSIQLSQRVGDVLIKGPHIKVNGVELVLTRDLGWVPWKSGGGKKVEDAIRAANAWLRDSANRRLLIEQAEHVLANPPAGSPTRNIPLVQDIVTALRQSLN